MKKIFIFYCGILSVLSVRSQDFSAYAKKSFTYGGEVLNYRILYPLHYHAGKMYPLIIFLHGIGERGSDNEKQLKHFARFFLNDSIRRKLESIVIFPQCPDSAFWPSYFDLQFDTLTHLGKVTFPYQPNPSKPSLLLKRLTDSLVKVYVANPDRLYIGGLSLGGFGTYDFIERYPGYFAAAFPICGGGDTSFAESIAKKTSVWIFHGSADPVIHVEYARLYYEVLKKYGADVKYMEYKGVGHNSWENAMLEPGLLEWIQEKKKFKATSKN